MFDVHKENIQLGYSVRRQIDSGGPLLTAEVEELFLHQQQDRTNFSRAQDEYTITEINQNISLQLYQYHRFSCLLNLE